MKVLLLGDIHLSDNPPAARREGYLEEVLDLLWQTVEIANRENAVPVWAGDVFHLKTPGRNSFRMVGEAMDVANSYDAGLLIVPGNHDLTHDRLDSLPSQPLNMLLKLDNVELLQGLSRSHGYIYGVPWLQRFNDETVSDALESYREVCDDGLVVTHAPLYPPGKELPYEFYDTEKWAQAMGNNGSVFYGHVHNPHGVYSVGGVQFCNNGALSRGSLDESNLSRSVVATMYSSIDSGFRTVPLEQKNAGDLFKMEVKAKREAQIQLDDFLASIGEASLEITTSSAVMDHIRSLGLGTEVESLIQDLLDSVEI